MLNDFRREHYEVSALLQYIPCRERQKTPEGLHEKDGVQYLTGLLYAPLREEFSHLSFDKPREKSILLSTGGTDLTIWRAEFLRTAHRCRNCRSICGM